MSWWYNLQMNGLKLFISFTYIFYIGAVIGVAIINPAWYRHLDMFMKLYIGLFLVVRFNPFRSNIHFTELDRQISFNAGIFVLSMFLINSIFTSYMPSLLKSQ